MKTTGMTNDYLIKTFLRNKIIFTKNMFKLLNNLVYRINH